MKLLWCTLLILLISACGKETVTLRVIPSGLGNVQPKNLLNALSSHPGFCTQPNLVAGVLLNSNEAASEIVSIRQVGFKTNIQTTSSPAPSTELADLVNDLKNPNYAIFESPIDLPVPVAQPISVGLFGLALLGGPESANTPYCKQGNQSATSDIPDAFGYLTYAGKIDLPEVSSSISVNLPVSVTKKVASVVVNNSLQITSSSLATNYSRKNFVLVWIKFPVGFLIKNVTLEVMPGLPTQSGLSRAVSLISSPSNTSPIVAASLHRPNKILDGTGVTSTEGFAVPKIFPQTYSISDSTNTYSITCPRLTSFRVYTDVTAGQEPVLGMLVDFTSLNNPTCGAVP